jgi:hypothetical protein
MFQRMTTLAEKFLELIDDKRRVVRVFLVEII